MPPTDRRFARLALLENAYAAFTRREKASADPVEYLFCHEDPLDREIIALIASSLAYGRVATIRRGVSWVVARLGPPRATVCSADPTVLAHAWASFRHRFTTGDELVRLVGGIRAVIGRFGSLRECFLAGLSPHDPDTWRALDRFVRHLNPRGTRTSLLPPPSGGSACKRLHLFLRWLVRHDEVDPGGWEDVGTARLIVPLDTHMFRLATRLGLTTRRCATAATATEITDGFRALRPDDPVRYDFALMHMAMSPRATEQFVAAWSRSPSASPASYQRHDSV